MKNKKETLYSMTERYHNLLDALLYMDVDDEEGRKVVEDAISAVGNDVKDKSDGYGKIIKELEYKAGAAQEEANRLTKLSKSYSSKIEVLKNNLMYSMLAMEIPRIDTELFKWSIRQTPDRVEIDKKFMEWVAEQPQKTRDKYLRHKLPEVDKTAVKTDLQAGEKIPYAELVNEQRIYLK
jgi:hypothetical protein